MITLKNILVATDFSEPSEAALIATGARSRATSTERSTSCMSSATLGARSTALRPTSPPCPSCSRTSRTPPANCDDLLVDNDEPPLPTRRVLITSNALALAIVDYARREHINLIVTGTHGRGAVAPC